MRYKFRERIMCSTGIVARIHIPDFRHLKGVLDSWDGAVDVCELAVMRELLSTHEDAEVLVLLEDVAIDSAP